MPADRAAAMQAVLDQEPGGSHAALGRRMEVDEATIRRAGTWLAEHAPGG